MSTSELIAMTKSATPAEDYVGKVFELLGYKPKEKYEDDYELLLDFEKACKEYVEKTGKGLPVQNISYSRVLTKLSNKEILKKILDRKEYRLLKVIRSSYLFDEEICSLYGEEILTYIKDTGSKEFPLEFNKIFFNKCFELYRSNKDFYKVLFTFEKSSFTSEVISELCKDHEFFVNYAIDGHLDEIRYYLPDLFVNRDIYSVYVKKVKENLNYMIFLIESPLIDEYYLEVREEVIKALEMGKIAFPKQLRANVHFFKDYVKSDVEVRGTFSNVALIRGVALNQFNEEEIELIIKSCGINESVENFVKKINYLYRVNDEFVSSLVIKILDSAYNCISLEALEKIVIDDDLQGIIIDLGPKKVNLVAKLLNKMDCKDLDLTNVIYTVLKHLDDCEEESEEFIKIVDNLDINTLTDEQLDCLILVLSKESNMYNVTCADDLKEENFRKLKDAYYAKIDKEIEDGSIDVEELKRAILEKKYGLDYTQASFIYKRYCKYLNGFKFADEEVYSLLSSINNIMKEKSIDVLIELYKLTDEIVADYYSIVSLESCIRKHYARAYADSLFKIKDHPGQLKKREATYQGEEVLVYDLSGDFRMQIHALGAYTRGEWSRPGNFKEDWDRPKIVFHGLCTSYIGNSQIATARPNGPILGFSDYEESALLVAGNYDLVSKRVNNKYSVSMHNPFLLIPPQSMLDFTRHNHNEMVIERRNISGAGSFKRQPDYIVYIVDDANDLGNFSSDNDYYQQTLQAARDFGVPVIVIDRLAYAKSELKKALVEEKKFYEIGDFQYLKNAFMIYANNEVGCRVYPEKDKDGKMVKPEPKEYQKIFNVEAIKAFIARTIDNVLSYPITDEKKIELLRKIFVLLKNEETKFSGLKADIKIDYTAEIERVNQELVNLGSEEFKIGK